MLYIIQYLRLFELISWRCFMFEVVTLKDVYSESIELDTLTQSAGNKPLSMRNIHLLQSVLVKLSSGEVSISSCHGDTIVEKGPVLIFLAKGQVVNINLFPINDELSVSSLQLDARSIKSAYEAFLHHDSTMVHQLTSHTRYKHLSAPIIGGTDKIFEVLQVSMKTPMLEIYKKDYLLSFLLSSFLAEPYAFTLFKVLSEDLLKDKIKNILISDVSYQWTLKRVAEKLFMSQSTIKRKLASENSNFSKIYLDARMGHAKKLLISGACNIKQTSFLCGYESVSYFSKVFKSFFKVTPSEFIFNINCCSTYTPHS